MEFGAIPGVQEPFCEPISSERLRGRVAFRPTPPGPPLLRVGIYARHGPENGVHDTTAGAFRDLHPRSAGSIALPLLARGDRGGRVARHSAPICKFCRSPTRTAGALPRPSIYR